MNKKETSYLFLFIFFALGYFFGFCIVGILTYPIIKFDGSKLEYAMKNGMICGFFVGLITFILFLM